MSKNRWLSVFKYILPSIFLVLSVFPSRSAGNGSNKKISTENFKSSAGNITGNVSGILYNPLEDKDKFGTVDYLRTCRYREKIGDSRTECKIRPQKKYLKVARAINPETSLREEKIEQIASLPQGEFLELISRKTFNYFWNEASSETGFIKDRSTPDSPSSIAATGFGLASICIAHSRGWITHQEAYKRVRMTLISIRDKAAHIKGFFYHFINMNTGKRELNSEISSIDTALLLAGVLTVQEYFTEKELKDICGEIYERVDWKWMMEANTKALYMGWVPEHGFKKFILWDMFAEEMVMYIMGMGAPHNPLPAESWHSFERPIKTYKDFTYIFCTSESLFTYLYSHAFIDFSNRHDEYADYWKNSEMAIKAAIVFSREQAGDYRTYREGFWGISASDGPDGYRNYGATIFTHDGTVAPYAICGSVPFVPGKAISALRSLLPMYGSRVWNKNYGFVSAFNLDKGWFSDEHVGIDLGISLLMIENHRSGFIWKHFMKSKYIIKGMQKAGFRPGTKEVEISTGTFKHTVVSVQKRYFVKRAKKKKFFGGNIESYDFPGSIEYGEIRNDDDLDAKFAFTWDKNYLYFIVDVRDDVICANRGNEELYKDDAVELFLSAPGSDNLEWGDGKNFQIGFAPNSLRGKPAVYAFFQKKEPGESIKLKVKNFPGGYRMKAKIKWGFLNMKPEQGKYLGMSVAVHDVDVKGEPGKKINWFFKNSILGIKLGRMILQ